MKLEDLLESLEKVAEAKAPTEADDKPKVSKELDALLTKEAATANVNQALVDGEKLAHSVLEALSTKVIEEATKQAETKIEATPADDRKSTVEKVAQDVKATAETKAVEKKAETKVETTETKEEDMNKQATDAGKALAEAILEKLADLNLVGKPNGPASENSGPDGAVHKIQQDHAKDVAQDDKKIGSTPGRNGTFNQLFDAIVAKAKAVSNATGYDQMATGPAAAHEAKDQAMGTPSIPASPDVQEKQAAVQFLCEAGATWEEAVELVKNASEELIAEEISQVKMAAVGVLVDEGMDFDTAVDAVRTAVSEVTADEGK